jgi:hypothetical protein
MLHSTLGEYISCVCVCVCVCVVGGTLPCSQQPVTLRYLAPGESSLHPAFIFKTLFTNLCESLLRSLETAREEL